MKLSHGLMATAAIGLGLAMSNPAPLVAAAAGYQADRDYGDLRGVIDRTQNDLQVAAQLEQSEKERERYKNTQTKLSDLDRALSKGHFDKGKLDACIKDIDGILNHNTLQPSGRDALKSDVTALKVARDSH